MRIDPRSLRRPAAILLGLLLAVSCGKEKPSAEAKKGPASAPQPEPTETAAPERRPTILAKADASKPPFSGLLGPRDSALDSKGRLWVADFGHNGIAIFDSAGGSLGGWGGRGSGDFQFKEPCAIAVSGDSVYVADTWNGRVEQFSTSGELKSRAPGDFYGPRGIAVAPDGRVWIADTGNNRVVLCEKDLTKPRFFGKKGTEKDQFLTPVGISVGANGMVYVADTDNKRIQILDGDGNFKSRWKFAGWGPSTEGYLDVDADGTVYVTDPPAQAVARIDRNGRETRRWTADDAGQKFAKPTGITLDSKGRVLYISNSGTGTIVKLKLSGKP